MRTIIDFGDAGTLATDEPVEHGGSNEGPTPLQAVAGALCGCESVTFHRTAEERGFPTRGSPSRPSTGSTFEGGWAGGRTTTLPDHPRRGRRRDERVGGSARVGRRGDRAAVSGLQSDSRRRRASGDPVAAEGTR
jgi:hypothetical protein